MLAQPRCQRAQSAQRDVRVFRAHRETEVEQCLTQRCPRGLRASDRSHQHVRMAADVLSGRVHADIDAALQRLKVKRRGPRVVDRGDDAALARQLGQQRHVLHLERQRARRFEPQQFRVRPELCFEFTPRRRRVEARLHAVARQRLDTETACWTVRRIGHQHMIAGTQERQHPDRARRQAGRHRPASVAAFELA